jgi:hypothetical protein
MSSISHALAFLLPSSPTPQVGNITPTSNGPQIIRQPVTDLFGIFEYYLEMMSASPSADNITLEFDGAIRLLNASKVQEELQKLRAAVSDVLTEWSAST